MNKLVKRLLIAFSVMMSFLIIVFLLNQIMQFSATVSQFHPIAGQVTLIVSITVLSIAVILPLALFLLLPAPLIAPRNPSGKEYEQFLERYKKRLIKNKHIDPETRLTIPEDIEPALKELNTIADARVKQFAKRAFYTTAISQNGALDALFMIALQFKLIWDVAHIYHQRPTIKDMSSLYTNVLATAFIASQLEEAEYIEMLESAMNTVFGSAVSLVPGTAIVVNSVLTGASNTFLTLRVGIITKQYCNTMERPTRSSLRNSAALQASKQLGTIVTKGAMDVFKLMGKATIKKPFSVFKKEKS